MKPSIVVPSLLSAPFDHLGDAIHVLEQAGVTLFHYDVMDGHFVPNITFGPLILKCLQPNLQSLMDVHLMVSNPERQISRFDLSCVRSITIHWEASQNIEEDLADIRSRNKGVGISINPPTPVTALEPILQEVDQVLVMSVFPGSEGQPFMPEMLHKVEYLTQKKEREGLNFTIQIDGGVLKSNIAKVKSAGAEEIISGSAVFRQEDPVKAYRELCHLVQPSHASFPAK